MSKTTVTLGPDQRADKIQNLLPVQQLIGHAQQMLHHRVQNLEMTTLSQVSYVSNYYLTPVTQEG